jgi:hypothetical protein
MGEKPGFYEILYLVTRNLEINPVSEVISRGWGEKPGFYEILYLVTRNLEINRVSEVISEITNYELPITNYPDAIFSRSTKEANFRRNKSAIVGLPKF